MGVGGYKEVLTRVKSHSKRLHSCGCGGDFFTVCVVGGVAVIVVLLAVRSHPHDKQMFP